MKLFYSGSLDNIWCSLDQFKEEIKSLETKLDALTESYGKTKKRMDYLENFTEEVLDIHGQSINNLFSSLENKLKVLTENYENYKKSMHERLNIIERGIHPPFHSLTPICNCNHLCRCHLNCVCHPGRTNA